MAELFNNQAKHYSESRPTYPEELYRFITSKTPCHDLAWDVGTGSGQAARSLAKIYNNVVATDTSPKQLEFAFKLPNIRYQCTPPKMSITEVEQNVSAESSVDLVTSAAAIIWFDLPTFYRQVKWILKKPDGVIAAWSYAKAEINTGKANTVIQKLYDVCDPYTDPRARFFVHDKYETIDFPFLPVDGLEHTGPFKFKTERMMDLDDCFAFIKSWSSYQTAKDAGVELLNDDAVQELTSAWHEDGNPKKVATWCIYLKIGKVGEGNE